MFARNGRRSRVMFASLGVLALLSGMLLFPAIAGATESEVAPHDFPRRYDPERCVAIEEREFPRVDMFIDRIVEAGIVSEEQGELIRAEFSAAAQEACYARLMMSPREAASITADVTGTTTRDVWFAWRGGDSLATFAAGHGVSQDELVAALMDAAEANAAALVLAVVCC